MTVLRIFFFGRDSIHIVLPGRYHNRVIDPAVFYILSKISVDFWVEDLYIVQ